MKRLSNNAVIENCGDCRHRDKPIGIRGYGWCSITNEDILDPDKIHPSCPLKEVIVLDASIGRASLNRALEGWNHDYIIIVKKAKESE